MEDEGEEGNHHSFFRKELFNDLSTSALLCKNVWKTLTMPWAILGDPPPKKKKRKEMELCKMTKNGGGGRREFLKIIIGLI